MTAPILDPSAEWWDRSVQTWEADDACGRHMARFVRRDALPELVVRRELHRRGRRFFIDRRVSSRCRFRPDLVFPRSQIAVFVDECFWHYGEDHARLLKANAELWRRKLLANRQGDALDQSIRVSEGRRVLRFWEHEHSDDDAASVERALDRWSAIARTAAIVPGRMDRRIEVVAGVPTQRDGRALACRRANGRSAAGQWEFFAREVELGELASDALQRKLHEELGVDVVIGEPIHGSVTRVGKVDIDLATYRVAWASDDPTSSTEHDELRWVVPVDLGSLRWAPTDLPKVCLQRFRRDSGCGIGTALRRFGVGLRFLEGCFDVVDGRLIRAVARDGYDTHCGSTGEPREQCSDDDGLSLELHGAAPVQCIVAAGTRDERVPASPWACAA
ncbi:NUDIX domain-containing protein [Curtobacterium flaccumfaciens]|uniref:NUDIX domain-containing protein n=1 Tax=Curtobacterium flaccumfaciens TaxID=2035 RepID=UPI001ADD2639|nr:NUDIX domain-containing protein [Curtobacterium flaccumfaciens]MBO9040628.1 NUDIX domain-containing protein [Curtobacterium flaccumfaciens pv. flaccumfaciens]